MTAEVKWTVALVCPGEEELSLMAELSSRADARIVGIIDPDGLSLGAGLAEIMGLKVYPDLESLPVNQARYLIHPLINDQIAPFVDAAPDHNLEALTARQFSGLMLQKVLAQPTEPRVERPRVNHDFLETETATIHRTLSRLEEALDREALLRWLLGLATRATRASSGSIMLLDEPSGELYLAFAYGLSETTMHRTRVRIGEGISGQVAASGKTQLITDNRHPGSRRDRSSVNAAICAPIHWDNTLIGVLNISTSSGEDSLAPNALDIVESLTHRFGMILDRFLRMQAVHNSQQFHKMEEEFVRDTGQPELIGSTLVYWAEDLANLAEADEVSLSVLTADGDLLVADSEEFTYESPPSPLKNEVLATGNPRVLRPQDDGGDPHFADRTEYILPVGKAPCRALVSLAFYSPAKAHHFHTISRDVLFLINRHLNNMLEKVESADQVDRLTTLAAALSALAASPPTDNVGEQERLLTAVCSLTGGQRAGLMANQDSIEGCYLGESSQAIREEAGRLLEQGLSRGWSSSIMTIDYNLDEPEQAEPELSMLVVPLKSDQPFPGLVILEKSRLHPLDGSRFTEFDALFAKRLAPLFGRPAKKPEPEPQVVSEEQGLAALEPKNLPPGRVEVPPLPASELDPYIRSEMDRCDRYHTRMGLVAFRLAPPTGPVPDVGLVVKDLAGKLRTSDRAGALEDGTILVIVPEDIQSLPRLQKRATTLIQEITGQGDLVVKTAARVYPGSANSPEELVHSVLQALD